MSRPRLLFELVAAMSPPSAREIIRPALKAFSAAEHAEWTALQNAKRQREFKARTREKSNDCEKHSAVTNDNQSNGPSQESTVTKESESNGEHLEAPVTNPSPSPLPSTPPLSTPPPVPVPTPTPVRGQPPTVEQVLTSMGSMIVLFPPTEYREIAEAYIDSRERCDPPWHTKPTHTCPIPQPINTERWHADFRGFLKAWRGISQERAARQQGGQFFSRSARPRAEPDLTPLAVDVALYRQFLNDPNFSEFHVLRNQPVPTSEADMRPSAREAWKTFKCQHSRTRRP